MILRLTVRLRIYMTKEFTEESLFCVDCTDDSGLQDKIRQHGSNGCCSVCGQAAEHAITCELLSNWLADIWSCWYGLGEEVPVFDNRSDKVWYEQKGDEAGVLISDIIRCNKGTDEALVCELMRLMCKDDDYHIRDGGDPTIDDCLLYEGIGVDWKDVEDCWNGVVKELKHHTRYFNESAERFFQSLFTDVEILGASIRNNLFPVEPLTGIKSHPVLRTYQPGALPIYRARKVNAQADLKKIIDTPAAEMGNPPDELASEGRMNPKGISYFYGAEDRETCVAELRPSLSEKVVSAEFQLSRTVRLLDMTQLSRACGIYSGISPFDDDYGNKMLHRNLLRELHRRIAQPVLDGDEFDYLPTQAMAEYLARKSNLHVDGIVFASVQREEGRNIVLFPHVLGGDNHSSVEFLFGEPAITLVTDSLIQHCVKEIRYELDDEPVDKKFEKMLVEYPELIDWDAV